MTRRTRVAGVTVAAVLGCAVGAAAQTTNAPERRLALGAMISAAINGDADVTGRDVGPDFAVNGDVVVANRWLLRGEFGRATWAYEGSNGLESPMPPEQVTLTRGTITALRKLDWVGASYVGAGAGLYHYDTELSDPPRRLRPGGHVMFTTEAPVASDLTIRFEGFLRAVVGPRPWPRGEDVRRGPDSNHPGRMFDDLLFLFGGGVGIGWRF